MSSDDAPLEVRDLEERFVAFIRAFGLHQPDQTPCGQPLSVSEAHALTELQKQPGLTASELAKRLRLDKSTVSRLAAQLEKQGWVVRQPHPNDRRASALYLSESGQHLAEQVAAARRNKLTRLFDTLPETERAPVVAALSALTKALDQAVTEASDDDPKDREALHVTTR